jgi:AraC-like DNA-binding protein
MDPMPTIHSEGFFARFENQFRPFVAELGIPDAVFTRQDVEVVTTKYAELLETVAREVDPYFGLEMGENLTAKDMGVVGHAISAAPDIGTMLRLMSVYLYVFSQSNTMRLDVGENRAALTYKVTILSPEKIRQDAECTMAYATSLIRRLSGVQFKPELVEFVHARPKSVSRHQQLFGCEVVFGRKSNRLHFDKRILGTPVLTSDPGLLRALRFYLDDKIKVRSETEDIITKIRHLISGSLVNGVPDQKRIADQLGMSARTLQRKLRDKEVVFADLVDEIRYAIARDYLPHTEFSLTDVAMMLGYGELSSFSRAFKRWTGSSPDLFRKSYIEESGKLRSQ